MPCVRNSSMSRGAAGGNSHGSVDVDIDMQDAASDVSQFSEDEFDAITIILDAAFDQLVTDIERQVRAEVLDGRKTVLRMKACSRPTRASARTYRVHVKQGPPHAPVPCSRPSPTFTPISLVLETILTDESEKIVFRNIRKVKKHDQVKYTCKHIGRVSFGAAARVRLTVHCIHSPPGGTAFSSRPGHPVDAPGTPGCSAHRKPRKLRLRERISDSRAGTRQWPTRCARSSSAGTNTFTLHLTSYNRQSGLFAV